MRQVETLLESVFTAVLFALPGFHGLSPIWSCRRLSLGLDRAHVARVVGEAGISFHETSQASRIGHMEPVVLFEHVGG